MSTKSELSRMRSNTICLPSGGKMARNLPHDALCSCWRATRRSYSRSQTEADESVLLPKKDVSDIEHEPWENWIAADRVWIL